MTAHEREALDYFDARSKEAYRDPELKEAFAIIIATFNHWTKHGFEESMTAGGHAALRWFMTWDKTGRTGGLARFSNGLRTAMRWTAVKVKPHTKKFVRGVDPAGLPHCDPAAGQCPAFTRERAGKLVSQWNLYSRVQNSQYRYAMAPHRSLPKNMRKIYRYELVFDKEQQPATVSIEEYHENHISRSRAFWEEAA